MDARPLTPTGRGGGGGRRRAAAVALALVAAVLPWRAPGASADDAQFGGRPGEPTHHRIAFPVEGGARYSNDWGAPRGGGTRQHVGNDLFAPKHTPVVAAVDGVISWVRVEDSGNGGRMLSLRGDDGWQYRYIHLNNDTPGTDDGAAPPEFTVVPGIDAGVRVRAGQRIAFVGDSGNAEETAAHVHFEILPQDSDQVNPFPSLRLSQGQPHENLCRWGSNPPSRPSDAAGRGYWLLDRAGGVFTFGDVGYHGSVPGLKAAGAPIGDARGVVLAPTPSGEGYWILDDAGGVFTFGDAAFHGSVPQLRADGRPIGDAGAIGLTAAPSGDGYWVLDDAGGVFAFGSARFQGSVPGLRAEGRIGSADVVAMAASPRGDGYWVIDQRGGVFAFGSAGFHGSVPGTGLCQWADVVSVQPSATGRGYWMVGTDGRVWAFGDARYRGAADLGDFAHAGVVGMAAAP